MKAPKGVQLSTNGVKDIRLWTFLTCAEVSRRGGRVEIPRAGLRALLNRAVSRRLIGNELQFTLTPSDEKVRDSTTYDTNTLYRLDMVVKYLILTAPEQMLTCTNEDLRGNYAPVTVMVSPARGLLATSDTKGAAPGRHLVSASKEEALQIKDFGFGGTPTKH